jgi:hypothetical protein
MAHAWQRLPETTTVEERIKALENDKGNAGSAYNACVARKYIAQGKKVDVSLRFKCADADCNAYQEVDMEVDGAIMETKGGSKTAKKKQTLNYVEISQLLYNGRTVVIVYQSLARALRDAAHVFGWGGAAAKFEPCP